MRATTYEEALRRVEDLTVRIRYLEDQMNELLERMLAQNSWFRVIKILNQRQAVVSAQHVLLNEWNQAMNELVGFLEFPERERMYARFRPGVY
ncbi:hypothetical protein KDA_42420 [Dictyobacter alpinus]|uniref:Uncharacterized protein n=1 Tax=Dictyobacter alpinus TaxID=2014873 RepID=A0A402BBF4_9CHLR|nr:hypothetical protein [Dictyobacter alpinus]GCE28758.1 hypothetical protein KDA_42420 [Dictyobacter alpinus]